MEYCIGKRWEGLNGGQNKQRGHFNEGKEHILQSEAEICVIKLHVALIWAPVDTGASLNFPTDWLGSSVWTDFLERFAMLGRTGSQLFGGYWDRKSTF